MYRIWVVLRSWADSESVSPPRTYQRGFAPRPAPSGVSPGSCGPDPYYARYGVHLFCRFGPSGAAHIGSAKAPPGFRRPVTKGGRMLCPLGQASSARSLSLCSRHSTSISSLPLQLWPLGRQDSPS